MENFLNNIMSSIGITDVLDILLVAFIVYKVLGFIRETRAEQLAKGLLVLVAATVLSNFLHLYTLHWLLSGLMTVGLIAIVVIFQPELRRALEHLGRSRFANIMNDIDKDEAKRMVFFKDRRSYGHRKGDNSQRHSRDGNYNRCVHLCGDDRKYFL